MVVRSARRFRLAGLATILAVLVSPAPGHSTCDPRTDPDRSDIANARAAVAAACDCAAPTTHHAYVGCAAQQAQTALNNKGCVGFVEKCAAHSTCGRPGRVTCCLTTSTGTSCRIKRDGAHCTARQGTVGSCSSCCDACPTPGSGPSCTTTTTLPPTCPAGQECALVRGPSGEGCVCTPSPACGPSGGQSCGGNCPQGANACHFDTDNGLCLCETGYLCGLTGAGCSSSASCCSGLCGSTARCACLAPGTSCSGDIQCCGVCSTTPGSPATAVCCFQTGSACTASTDCCSGICDASGHCGCLSPGAACPDGAGAACCSGSCQVGQCTCLGRGASCNGNTDCCSGVCDASGHCGCLLAGATCSPDGNSFACCSGACRVGQCTCSDVNFSCRTNAECCSGACNPSRGACCSPSGAACGDPSQCCSLDCAPSHTCS